MIERRKIRFWGADDNDDRLVRQILNGEKTATCCPSEYFDIADGDCDDGGHAVGDIVEVYDLKQRLRCLIEITGIYTTTLGAPPEQLWRGECCADVQEFVAEHLACWSELGVSTATPITASHFVLREIIDRNGR